MVAAGDEVADVFGDKDKLKGGNAIMQHALFPLAGKVSALSVGFLSCLRSNKKSFKKGRQLATQKLQRAPPIAGKP